jgi:hypothetical protein
VFLLVAVVGCGGQPASTAERDDEAGVDVSVVELDIVPVADAPVVADRGGAASRQVECQDGIARAAWSADAGPVGPPRNQPEDAIADFVEFWSIPIPPDDFQITGRDAGRLLYVHENGAVGKVAVVLADADGGNDGPWAMDVFAACDPSELDPSYDEPLRIWTDVTGERVLTSQVTTLRGAEHCGWQDVIYLQMGERVYLGGEVPRELWGSLVEVPAIDVEMPPDAVDTGLDSGEVALWMSPDESMAYVVSPSRVDSFAVATEPVWCA